MKIDIVQESFTAVADYASIPMAFRVDRVLDVETRADDGGTFILSERSIESPYVKDYDVIEGEDPLSWVHRFDLSNWALFAAREQGRRVGGAAAVFNTAGLAILEGRLDLAAVWDIRVLPDARCRGVGYSLFRAAEEWARLQGCRQLKVETQNINVPACKFYERQGCVLRAIHRRAYPETPEEIQFLWYKDLKSFPEVRG
jgi:GNAT superfamily N-acetyltransferase